MTTSRGHVRSSAATVTITSPPIQFHGVVLYDAQACKHLKVCIYIYIYIRPETGRLGIGRVGHEVPVHRRVQHKAQNELSPPGGGFGVQSGHNGLHGLRPSTSGHSITKLKNPFSRGTTQQSQARDSGKVWTGRGHDLCGAVSKQIQLLTNQLQHLSPVPPASISAPQAPVLTLCQLMHLT